MQYDHGNGVTSRDTWYFWTMWLQIWINSIDQQCNVDQEKETSTLISTVSRRKWEKVVYGLMY